VQNVAAGRGLLGDGVAARVMYTGASGALVQALGQRLGVEALQHIPARRERRIELDTIERSLERAGAVLAWECQPQGGVLEWSAADGRRERAQLAAAPAFAWDLEPGPLRQALGAVTGARRLLALREVERSERGLRRLDAQGKTVARLSILRERFRRPGSEGGWSAARTVIAAEPVRGYDVEHAELVQALEGLGTLRRASEQAPAARPAPGLPFPFDPPDPWPPVERVEPAARALRRFALRQLELAQAQEAGLRADLDSEFNHDLRVAVRRARALLGQLAGALRPDEVDGLREELAWLGRATGALRDLDVLLIELHGLERDLAVELEPLARLLEERRAEERAVLLAALDSPRWRELQAAWRRWSESPAPDGGPTLGELCAERIARRRRRVQREGARLGPEAPAQALHALRIECKKLRYVMECAGTAAACAELERCVRALKGLQEVLGEFNDARLQGDELEAWAAPLAQREPRALLSLGRLLERRRAAERAARARFAERFAGFAAHGSRRDFAHLCSVLRGEGVAAS